MAMNWNGKTKWRFFAVLAFCVLLSGCGNREDRSGAESLSPVLEETEQKSLVSDLPLDEIWAELKEIYDSRIFTEKTDLSQHSGLLNHAQVTGPFLVIREEDGGRFIPDAVGNEIVDNPTLPEGAQFVPNDAAPYVPEEYLALLQTEDKLDAVKRGEIVPVYCLLEYLGYSKGSEYSGGFNLYYHRTRVSFYEYGTGEMIGWMDTTTPSSGPMLLSSNDYGSDGKHAVLLSKNRSIWRETAWTKALDELFFDENGYQVVGTRLIFVPEDADPIRVPEGVTEIDRDVGKYHEAKELILPAGLQKIGYAAFSHSMLETIEIPETVCFCDDYVFTDTPWWEKQKDDPWLIVGDGVLLKCREEEEEIVIPDEVRYIAPEALTGIPCRKITISASVRQCFGSRVYDTAAAIMNLDNLEELVIEGGLQSAIPDEKVSILTYCDNLKTLEIACEIETLPDNWIQQNASAYEQMTIFCPDDSPAAVWAQSKGIIHKEH